MSPHTNTRYLQIDTLCFSCIQPIPFGEGTENRFQESGSRPHYWGHQRFSLTKEFVGETEELIDVQVIPCFTLLSKWCVAAFILLEFVNYVFRFAQFIVPYPPSQVQCCTLSGESPRALSCFLLELAVSYSPGRSAMASLRVRGTRIVAAFSRSLRFPTLRLPVSATGGGRLRSHWRRQAPVPQGAAMASPSQVQCCTLSGHGAGKRRSRLETKNDPAKAESLFVWNPAVSYSPGPSPAKYHRR